MFIHLKKKKIGISASSWCEGESVCLVPMNSCKVWEPDKATKLDSGVDDCKTSEAKVVQLMCDSASSSLNHCIQIYLC